MTTKITHHLGGFVEITGCPCCDDATYLWFYDGVWQIDTDTGMMGPIVHYCPACGVKLEPPPEEGETTGIIEDLGFAGLYRLIASPEGEYFRHVFDEPLPAGFREVPSASVDGHLLPRFSAVGRYGCEQHGWQPKWWEIRSMGLEKSE